MTATLPSRTNPYVGPRAFQQGEKLYGRDLEVMQLLHLLMAERIVLFHSPSGAGKTSLIQAALIPRLEEEGFHVLPPMRVSLGLSADEQVGSSSNRYVLSLLLSLEEGLPPEQRTPLAELLTLTLGEYLDRRQDGDEALGTVLIFDQFEEILTLDPIDRELKLEFFAQVGAALRDRRRWALFAMREEFIAALEDAYLRPIPTRLRVRYRLGLLAPKQARQAIQEPAKAAGVAFTDAAADKLVRDLSTVRVLQPDGSTEKRPGPYVEPVQLQVVCRRLWDLLPAGASQIVEEDIGRLADVDLALSGYYDQQVQAARSGYYADQVQAAKGLPSRLGVYGKAFAAALGFGLTEGTIRNWFDGKLITEQGIRDQVLEGPEESEGLDNRAIRPLVGAHLVRAERRRGANWLELAHDRLIEPVQASNAAWRRARLTRRIAVGFTLIAILAIALAIWAAIAQKTVTDLRAQLTALTVTATPTTVTAMPTTVTATPTTVTATPITVTATPTTVTATPITVTATPTATVTPVPAANNKPVANDDSPTTNEDTAVTINVACNDSDVDGNLDAASANSRCAHGSIGCIGAAHGTLADSGNGTITYTPNPDWNGSDGFVYEICDSGTPARCDTAAVVITVVAINDPPVAKDDSETRDEATAVTINAVENDWDLEGNLDPGSANVTIEAANGKVINNGDGTFEYRPNLGYYGSDSFEYEICDSDALALCDKATVAITAAACSFEAQGLFAGLWQDNRNWLGCPIYPTPKAIQDAEQAFETGRMLWRADNMRIYVLYGDRDGTYQTFSDGLLEGDGSVCRYPCDGSPPRGLWPPKRGFRVAWCYLCDRVAPIGWGRAGEQGFGPGYGDPLVQDFEGGVIFRDSQGKTQRQVYILFADGTFVRVPYDPQP